eukprot:scaffold56190_cov18-Tisochrysis_lutea.AAC.1
MSVLRLLVVSSLRLFPSATFLLGFNWRNRRLHMRPDPHTPSTGKGDALAQRAASLPHQRVRGKIVWIWWVSGSMQSQRTRVMMGATCLLLYPVYAHLVPLHMHQRQSQWALQAQQGRKGCSSGWWCSGIDWVVLKQQTSVKQNKSDHGWLVAILIQTPRGSC